MEKLRAETKILTSPNPRPKQLMIEALIFDFDGLILDTETPDYLSWQKMYAEFGLELPLDVWHANIGSADLFNP